MSIAVGFAVLALLVLVPLIGIIDAAQTPDSVWRAADQNKVAWILLQIFLGVLGTLAFYTAIKPSLSRAKNTAQASNPAQPQARAIGPVPIVLRVLTALALAVVAIVHLKIAGNYAGLGSHPLALNDQFYAQAAVAFVLALAVVVRPHPIVWVSVAGFAAGSFAVLLFSRYNCLPIYGFDGCFQETWDVEGAKGAAYSEIAALVLGAVGAAMTVPAFLKARTTA